MKNSIIKLKKFNYNSSVHLENVINDLMKSEKTLNIALSGGQSPMPILKYLSKKKINFNKILFFLVDERNYSNHNSLNNYFNLKKNFFRFIESTSFPIISSKNLEQDSLKYEELIVSKVDSINSIPSFDLIILGMGLDGHTASLFPNSEGLNEKKRLIIVNEIETEKRRITMTYPLILNAKKIILIINNQEKVDLLHNINAEHPIKRILDTHKNIDILCKKD